MRLARALRAAPDAVEYLYRIERKQRSEDRVTKADLLRRDGRPSYLVDYYSGEPAKLSDLATEEGWSASASTSALHGGRQARRPARDPDRVAPSSAWNRASRPSSRSSSSPGDRLPARKLLGPRVGDRDFALETFKIGYGHESRVRGSYQTAAQARGLEVRYSEVSGRWSVTSASGGMDESVAKKWGVGSYNCFMILTAALNGGLIQIEKDNPDYNPVAEKSKKKIPTRWQRPPPTPSAASSRRPSASGSGRTRTARHARRHLQPAQPRRPRAYSGDYLSLPGMSPDIQLRKHQRDAVARIIQDGEGTLIAHTVGAGKTFTGITAMHELKRLGRARKPMIVVPNNLTEQWAADYLKLYPDAKLLVLTDAAAKAPTRCAGSGAGGIGRLGRRHRRIQPLRKTPDVIRCAEGGAHGAHRRARGIQTHGAGGRRRGEGLLGQADRGRARQVQEQAPVAREAKRIQDARGRDVRGGRLRRDLRRRGPLLQEPRGVRRLGARHADQRRGQVRGPSDEVRVPAR
ncbi:MAG: DEAD/DEAH box helicase family protein [Collinsella stercoris]|uniref:DEAD/DEAH box helicase family protein n=1 Tax=Collinsella stercoris TaxID=147206 RepID=UPI003992EE7A